jgi:hypothetical protein
MALRGESPEIVGSVQRITDLPSIQLDSHAFVARHPSFLDRQSNQRKSARPMTKAIIVAGLVSLVSPIPSFRRCCRQLEGERYGDSTILGEKHSADVGKRLLVSCPVLIVGDTHFVLVYRLRATDLV